MLRFLITLVILAAVSVGGWLTWRHRHPAATPAATENTVEVALGDLRQTVSSTGKVVSNLDVDIKCQTGGQVVEMPYDDIGMKVKKDSLLLQLDPVDQKRAVHTTEVALRQSQARLAEAKQNLVVAEQSVVTARQKAEANIQSAQVRAQNTAIKADRLKELLSQNLGSKEEYETAQTDAAQAAADLQQAKVALEDVKTQQLALEIKRQDVALAEADAEVTQIAVDNANQQLAYTTVTAPMDGVVTAINVRKGSVISSGITNVGGGTTIMTLADLSKVFVLASVDESDIGHVAEGQDVVITVDSYKGEQFQGKVVRKAPTGTNISNVVTFEVKIEVTTPNKEKLRPGMTANVEIVTADDKNVLLVPAAAVSRKGDAHVVTVKSPTGATAERTVDVGATDGDRYVVNAGLAQGDKVVVRGGEMQSKWSDSQPGGPQPPPPPAPATPKANASGSTGTGGQTGTATPSAGSAGGRPGAAGGAR